MIVPDTLTRDIVHKSFSKKCYGEISQVSEVIADKERVAAVSRKVREFNSGAEGGEGRSGQPVTMEKPEIQVLVSKERRMFGSVDQFAAEKK